MHRTLWPKPKHGGVNERLTDRGSQAWFEFEPEVQHSLWNRRRFPDRRKHPHCSRILQIGSLGIQDTSRPFRTLAFPQRARQQTANEKVGPLRIAPASLHVTKP